MAESGALVLVVEDSDALCALLTTALELAGHRALTAPDAATALSMLDGSSPDVVLLDLALPDQDGLVVLDQLKRKERTTRTPVLVVTARDDARVMADALARGAHDFVVKPFRMPELLARVDAAVRVKRDYDHLVASRTALRDRVDFTEAVMNTIDSIVVVLDREGLVVRFNRAAEEISGYREEELAGRLFWDLPLLAPDENWDQIRRGWESLVRGEGITVIGRIERGWRTRSGGRRVISWSNTTLDSTDGNVAFAVGTGVDVTDLREADSRLHACLDVLPGSIFILDPILDPHGAVEDFQIRYLNREAAAMLPPASIKVAMTEGSRQFMTGDQFRMLVDLIGNGVTVEDEADVELEGQSFTFAYAVARMGSSVVLSLRDITDVRATQDQLAWAANHDALTGLAGRSLLVDRLQRALTRRRANPDAVVGVLFVDLDGFKAVNDGLGHAAGDALLVAVARALEATVRPSDTVARFGGDEFVVVAEDVPSADDLPGLAERVGAAVAGIEMDGYRLKASVGLALAGPEDDPDAILRLADQVMYEKKRRPA